MLAAALTSRRTTSPTVYSANDFSFGPIREVAIFFVGIFSTMVPALQWLEHNADDLHLRTPGQFYYASGVLSSVLDNAPTYVTFLKARAGELEKDEVAAVHRLLTERRGDRFIRFDEKELPSDRARGAAEAMIRYHEADVRAGKIQAEKLEVAFLIGLPSLSVYILAISAGSVFWGAVTYIGNGPNFMVKSIADAGGIRTPTFPEYIYKYSLPILIPVYVVVWAVFFLVR
jgi:Na+/H+ antiporter NhaD/arsenite permease-like protein